MYAIRSYYVHFSIFHIVFKQQTALATDLGIGFAVFRVITSYSIHYTKLYETVPIFFPVVQALGFDPIWFGVIIVLVTEMGVVTPPVGVNVYVVHGVAKDVPLETIFRA